MQKCEKQHRYTIETSEGPFRFGEDLDRAQKTAESMKARGTKIQWVAYHPVGVEVLVEEPTAIKTYCSRETKRLEEAGTDD